MIPLLSAWMLINRTTTSVANTWAIDGKWPNSFLLVSAVTVLNHLLPE
jgi:hypothetical protein